MKKIEGKPRAEDWFDRKALKTAQHFNRPNEKLYYIEPKDFLKLARVIKKGYSASKMSGVKKLIENQIKFSSIPHLRLIDETDVDEDFNVKKLSGVAYVANHEGRHRMMNLRDMGYKKAPVIVKFHKMTKKPTWVINQDTNYKVKFDKVFKPYR